MAKFQMMQVLTELAADTARLGAGTTSANWLGDTEVGKFVKLVADSRYDLCAVGDAIEGFIESISDGGPQDNYSLGTVRKNGRKHVIADGLQATPGTGAIVVGDWVVTGSVIAKGTALDAFKKPKVCKATQQPGTVPADLTAAGLQVRNAAYGWRVVSIITGTGAVGDEIVIERVGF